MITIIFFLIALLDIIFSGFSVYNFAVLGACLLCFVDCIFLGDRLI